METEKYTHSLLTAAFLIMIIFFTVIVMGSYMNDRWKKIRDVKRTSDAQQVIKAIEIYKSINDTLPENETLDSWDRSYDLKTANAVLFKTLRDRNLISQVFDPTNNEQFYYRYHKFDKGEYGCSRAFAIFQVVSFETNALNIGSGLCPKRDFTKEALNGYTVQWFE